MVAGVQEVYKSQAVDINDKHIELIVRQLMKKVRVDQKGDTALLPGMFIDRHEYARINDSSKREGGETAQPTFRRAAACELRRRVRATRELARGRREKESRA